MSFQANTVRIQRLSDDEDVDITDEGADTEAEGCGTDTGTRPGSPSEEQTDPGLTWTGSSHEGQEHSSPSLQTPPSSFFLVGTEEPGETEKDEEVLEHQRTGAEDGRGSSPGPTDPPCGVERDTTGEPRSYLNLYTLNVVTSCTCVCCLTDSVDKTEDYELNQSQEEEPEEEDEEEEELKAPEQEVEMDTETITEDEKQAIPEFFEGRPSKTPERYLKIRNYILDQWYCKYIN